MMTINDFVHKHNLKNITASNMKIYQVLSPMPLSDVGIYLGDGPISNDIGIVNSHPSKGTQWVAHINENYFDSCGCSPLQKLSKSIKKGNEKCLYFEYKIQGLTKKNRFLLNILLFIYSLLD